MFIFSFKLKSIKFICVAALCVAVVAVAIGLLPSFSSSGQETISVQSAKITYDKIKGEENVVSFLSQFGYELSPLIEEVEITIPKKFDSVYEEYNKIQKAQCFDLGKYRGKQVKRYTYELLNCPKNSQGEPFGKVFVNVIVYREKVIGGDICTAELGGKVVGLANAKDICM